MRKKPPFCGKRGSNSFTLVEVVIAIGVVSFVLISILGLMTYTSQLVQQADTYSRLSHVTSQILTRINSQPYSVSTNAATKGTKYYFTAEGLPTNANASGAYYECLVTNANPSPVALANLMQVKASIRWPKPQFTNTNVIITSTLKYD